MTRRRLAVLLLVVVGLTGCGRFISGGGRTFGPEQFEFVVEPGTGAGPRAESLAIEQTQADAEMRYVEGSAVHKATVGTPAGTLDLFTFRATGDQGPISCEALMGPVGGSMFCGSGPPIEQAEPSEPLESSGTGATDTWSEATIRVRSDVASIVATARDGTTYELTPGESFAYVMWPSQRGALALEAFDSSGESLGSIEVPAVS